MSTPEPGSAGPAGRPGAGAPRQPRDSRPVAGAPVPRGGSGRARGHDATPSRHLGPRTDAARVLSRTSSRLRTEMVDRTRGPPRVSDHADSRFAGAKRAGVTVHSDVPHRADRLPATWQGSRRAVAPCRGILQAGPSRSEAARGACSVWCSRAVSSPEPRLTFRDARFRPSDPRRAALPVGSGIDVNTLADRVHVRYRVRLQEPDGWSLVEQQLYLTPGPNGIRFCKPGLLGFPPCDATSCGPLKDAGLLRTGQGATSHRTSADSTTVWPAAERGVRSSPARGRRGGGRSSMRHSRAGRRS